MFNLNFKKLFGFFALFALILTSFTDASFAGSHEKKKKKSYADGTCDPVQVVIHASYGGGTDTTARMMSIRTRRELGADIQVVGKRGGSGAKAQNYTLTRPKDGCTIMALTESHLYTMARGKSDMKIGDLVGVARAMEEPTFVVVNAKNSKLSTVKKMIKEANKKPIKVAIASIGGTEHIGMYEYSKAAGIPFQAVSFGSGAQSLQALAAGKVDASLLNPSEAAALIEDKKIKAIVLLHDQKLADYPKVPTSYSMGHEVKVVTTRGYAVLKGTPDAVVQELSKKMVKAMQHETFGNYLKGASLDPKTSPAGTEVWDKQLKENFKKAQAALKGLGLIK
ncbi:MAG: tripartite tricarboxylate transporter substrate binding protein [Pelagibacteraceae bacterium]|nr:tripartite tricarboxylate transporter substrate binding protein [Pelagibacteraceae bacterium]|tara:strand:+ start:577 stop:1587 length:1011 start_codon:yes stop_codon:yes gene_type:complete